MLGSFARLTRRAGYYHQVAIQDTAPGRTANAPVMGTIPRMTDDITAEILKRYFTSTSSIVSWLGPSIITARAAPIL